jgi:prolipoprotein diacylglyceryl transferase
MNSVSTWDALAAVVWDIDPLFVQLGPLQFRYYGILFALALMGGYSIFRWQYRRDGEDPEVAVRLTYWLIGGVIVGARLGHVFFYEPSRYLADPIEIIKFWKGGLASHGATIGLITVVAYYTWKVRRIPFRVIADRLAMAVPLATSCVRLGNFMNSEIVGRQTEVPWAFVFVRFDQNPRHPSQLYEVSMGLLLFLVMFLTDRYYDKRKLDRPLGLLTSLLLTGYFSMRFTVEFFKEYQGLDPSSSALTEGQYLSIPFVLMGLVGFWAVLWGPWKGQTARFFLERSGFTPIPATAGATATDDARNSGGDKSAGDAKRAASKQPAERSEVEKKQRSLKRKKKR